MVSPDTGWAIGGNPPLLDRILRTQDGGHTWADVSPPESFSEDRLLYPENSSAHGHFFDRSTGIVLFDSSGLVWRTENGGASWQSSSNAIAFPDFFSFPTRSLGWALAEMGHMTGGAAPVSLYRTSDSGLNWDSIVASPDDAVLDDCSKTGLDFVDERIGWITRACQEWGFSTAGQPYLDMTTNGGLTWFEVPLPPPAAEPKLFAPSSQFFYRCALSSPKLFSPRNGIFALSCTVEDLLEGEVRNVNYLYNTHDAGKSWRTFDMPGGRLEVIDQSQLWSILPHPAAPEAPFPSVWRIYSSGDGGASWTFVKETWWDGQFSFLDESLVFAVAFPATRPIEETALVRSDDGGATWEIIRPVTGP